jgi:hypothetical protein
MGTDPANTLTSGKDEAGNCNRGALAMLKEITYIIVAETVPVDVESYKKQCKANLLRS